MRIGPYLFDKQSFCFGWRRGVADVETDGSELIDLKDQLLQAGVKAGSVGER